MMFFCSPPSLVLLSLSVLHCLLHLITTSHIHLPPCALLSNPQQAHSAADTLTEVLSKCTDKIQARESYPVIS